MDNQNTINFENMLQKILEFIGSPEEEQKEILDRYQNLVIRELANQLLIKLENDPNPPPLALLSKLGDSNQTIQEILKVFDYINRSSSAEEKNELYNVVRLKMFMEIVEPIMDGSNKEDLAQIGQILKSDNLFYQLYNSSLNKFE